MRAFSRKAPRATLFDECCKYCPHYFVGSLFGALALQIHVQQIPDPLHGHVVVVVVQGGEGVLQNVRGVGQEDQGQHPLVHPVRVVDPLAQNGVLDLLDQLVLDGAVGHGVGRHVEEQEVLLLGRQNALLGQIFGQALADVLQLIAELEGVPGLAREVLDPGLNVLGVVGLLNVLEGLIQEDVSAGVRVFQGDLPTEEALASHPRPLQLDPAPEGQLNEDASPQSRGDAVVPEAGVALLVLEAQEQDFLHERESGLLGVPVVPILVLVVEVSVGVGLVLDQDIVALGLATPLDQSLSSVHGIFVAQILSLFLLFNDCVCECESTIN